MFEDFKKLSYSPSINKIQKLKDIFDRLSLDSLEERLNRLNNIVDSLDTKVQNYQKTIAKGPIARFCASPRNGRPPLLVVFNGSSSYDLDGHPLIYFWDFGDGHTSNEMILEHVYTTIGYYIVSLTVINTKNLSNTLTAIINVGNVPIPPPTNIPDLEITTINSIIYSNYVSFDITITNVGTSKSSISSISGNIPGYICTDGGNILSLAPGQSTNVNMQIVFDPNGEEKNVTFDAYINPGHGEINLSNNGKSKNVTIKSTYPANQHTYIIVHVHNPEGKEIGSCDGAYPFYPNILLDGITNIPAATYLYPHNYRNIVTPGSHTISVNVNGMILTKTQNFTPYSTSVLTFIFPRTNFPLTIDYSGQAVISHVPPAPGIIYSNTIPFRVWTSPYLDTGYLATAFIDFKFNYQMSHFAFGGSVLEGGGQAFVGVGAVFDGWPRGFIPIDINIPAMTNFNYWTSQWDKNGYFPAIGVVSDDSQYIPILDTPKGDGYNITVFHANLHFISLLCAGKNYGQLLFPGQNYSQSFDGIMTGLGWKISNIPYDINGTAF